MSGVSTQGAGAAACANAEVVSAASAAAAKTVLVENLVIILAPSNLSEFLHRAALNKSRTPLPRQYDEHFAAARPEQFVISRFASRDYLAVSV
jgi:hypothetical protein